MAIKLTNTNLIAGNGIVAIPLTATLMLFSSLTPPVSITDMRNSIEAAQAAPFDNNDWSNLVNQLASLSLDQTVLTLDERTVYNELRAAASIPPSRRCCGTLIPSLGDGKTSIAAYPHSGNPNHVTIEISASAEYTCDIAKIQVEFNPVGAAPDPVSEPVPFMFSRCEGEKSIWGNYDVEFPSNPTGGVYGLEFVYIYTSGATSTAYVPVYQLTIP